MCIVKHIPSGKILKVISRNGEFITFMEIESGIIGDRHKACKDQFELIKCDNICKDLCFLHEDKKHER